jgi:DNA-binding transcriptional LysR family regulator
VTASRARPARPADAGERLVVRARRILDALEQARHEPAGLAGETLRLGTFQTAGRGLPALLLGAFERAGQRRHDN